jgi:hypothetical protein
MKKGFLILPLFAGFSLSGICSENNYQIHLLKPGETLSDLLYSKDYKPLYGKNNWVAKVLEMNHLKLEDAGKIKKGYPIILPQDSDVSSLGNIDEVSTGQASTMSYGLIGNKISHHQNVFIDFTHSRRDTNLKDTTISQNENFRVGLTFEDKNIRTTGKLSWNPVVSLGVESHGSAEFSNNDSFSASYGPTWNVQAAVEFDHANLEYKFAPFLDLEETSNMSQLADGFEVRRDRLVSLGVKAFQTYEKNNIEMNFAASMGTSILSQNLNGDKGLQVFSSKIEGDVNLTRDYYVGLFWLGEQFSGSNLETASTFGLNLKYFIN